MLLVSMLQKYLPASGPSSLAFSILPLKALLPFLARLAGQTSYWRKWRIAPLGYRTLGFVRLVIVKACTCVIL